MQAAEGHITCDACRLLLNGPLLHAKEPMSRISFRSLVQRRGPSNQASSKTFMGDCQNYGPFLGPLNKAPYYNRDPKRDHNFDNPPHDKHV